MSVEAAVAAPPLARASVIPGLIASARPKQWTKNVVLFGALVFAHDLFSVWPLLLAAGAFLAFCLVSSASYVINDLLDLENDRLHPVKRFRPLAAGVITPAQGIVWAIVLACAGVGLGFAVGLTVGLAAAGYIVLMVGYSTTLKHLVIIDVFAIAAGFMLRAVTGALAIHVVISPWLYVCTLLLALFLGFSKRYNELSILQETAASHRRSLEEYTPELLEQMTSILIASIVMAYSLYTFSAESLPLNHAMMLTIPFVLYGIFRYQYLVHKKNLGGAPELVLLRDLPLMLDVLLWGVTAVLVLYAAR
ncbi:MAG: decaprenyl-phosphate phosphoribosyltransferase [Chloroflexi bacterium]|nr:decaprenyl-phosphate phosphoribosyltransferase [Chloroflexota bacterium]